MGKAYRKQALDILTLLKQMQGKIQKETRRKNIKIAVQLLAEAQEAAIALGNSIEAYLGEGSNTVKAIEEYCEAIYRLHTALQEKSEFDSSLSELYSQWQQIRNFAEEELSDRYEMVFLPYKVSMWDSLESVWRAAEEDPDCDAYVMPIPYYDKNPDGTFRSEHYEGEEFPEDVPVTHYLEYDLEKRHPDIVFIHNPYDDHNFVTSVHPYFYSAKLKKYAEKLVYIPYYISAEINPDSRSSIEGKAGMALTNGVLHADMVFLQSENTKKLFVNILSEYIPEVKRSYWENKIWGLGSPKLDRVNRVVRDDARLPKDWHDLIYTESGLRKKVIFYNISISTLLKNPDMLNKIRDVLQFFKNCKGAALWWRPHPLYESTLASMRPDMLSEYQQMVNQYKQEGWGIFDDGVDLQWAIAETDAYYGDKSSVVQLFKEAEKPVMIQNVLVRTQQEIKAEDIPIWPSAFCVDGDEIWFIHGKMNVLMKHSMKENHTYVINTISKTEMFQEALYYGIYKWNNKMFFIPCWAREIGVYDINDKIFSKLSLKNIEEYKNRMLFCKVYEYGNCLYCIPEYYKAILKIDLESNDLEYITIKGTSDEYIADTTRVGNEVVAIFAETNKALFLDLESDTVLIRKIGKKERKFIRITNMDELLYLFDKNTHSVVKIARSNYSKEEKFCDTTYESIKMVSVFPNMFLMDSVYSHEMQIIDAQKKVIFQEESEPRGQQGSLESMYYSGIENSGCIENNRLLYFSRAFCSMYQFNGGKLEARFTLSLDKDEFLELKSLVACAEDKEINENDIYDLKMWTKKIEKMEIKKEIVHCNCGEKILETAKNNLGG